MSVKACIELTLSSRDMHWKFAATQLTNSFLVFYGTVRFIDL
jgi:hypothetical protein